MPQARLTSKSPHSRPAEFVRRQARLPEHRYQRLRRCAQAMAVTPSVLLCAAYAEVLRVWSASAHFTLNVTLSERPGWHPDISRLIGDFTSTVLLECDLSDTRDLASTATEMQAQLRTDLAHSAFGGVAMQRELARQGDGTQARMPVVFTGLLHEPDGLGSLEGVVFQTGYAVSQTPQVFLDNQVLIHGGDLVVSWDAVDESFPSGMIDDMFAGYVGLLNRISEDDSQAHAAVPVPVPLRQLDVRVEVNSTTGPLPHELIHAGVDRQVSARGDAPAVVTADRALSFRELDRRANQVAHRLRGFGAARNELVAIVMHKGWEQVVAALGITRAGAAYLPVDAGLPTDRIAELLTTAEVNTVLTQPGLTPPGGDRHLVVESQPWPDIPDGPVDAPTTGIDDLAYVIFTSGSTGRPKGVMITHRGAVNTLADVTERFSVGPQDRILGVSSLSFDLSVFDVFGVLGAGGAVVLPGAEDIRDPGRLAQMVREHQVTLWNTVPALLELLIEDIERNKTTLPSELRAVLLSGDWIPLSLPARVRAVSAGDPELYSLGGATEASIWSIWHPIARVDPMWRSIPYGTPLRNQTFHVLDPRLEPRPDLVPGELFIGGAGLAEGYWSQPQLTAESFLFHPATGERLYRTGDVGRYHPDGSIEFLGRQDTQVKVGGHRIELGEIEAVLAEHDAVSTAVAVASGPTMGPKHLIAYVVPTGEVDTTQLSAFLAGRLPAYMLPATIIPLARLPLTSNGKVDRSALPSPPQSSEITEPPSTPAEHAMAAAWREVLRVSQVGRNDNFFALGGDSLLGMRAVAKAAERGLFLTAAEFHRCPTVAEQARIARTQPDPGPTRAAVTGSVRLSPSQRWFFERDFAQPSHWNGMWPMFVLNQPLDPDLLERAARLVMVHHEALRTRFRRHPGGWQAEIVDIESVQPDPVTVVSLVDTLDDDLEWQISVQVAARNGSLNLADGPVVRLTYFDLGQNRAPRLLISAHWLVMDYYSSRVFYEDLRSAYFALEAGDLPQLPPRTASLPACLDALDAYAASSEVVAELPYWETIAAVSQAPLPVDFRLGENTQASAARHFSRITGDLAHAVVVQLPREHGVEIRDVLVAALVHALTAWTGRKEVLVELEGHGRERAYGELDVARTVARLSTLSPALLRADGLAPVCAQLAAIPQRGTGFGVLRYLHPDPRIRARLARTPAPDVGFNFWGDVSEYFTEDAYPVIDSFGYHRSESASRPRTLDLTALVVDGDLWLNWTYSTNLHAETTIRSLDERFAVELARLIEEL
ncbi:amino acid adenylation domain-containing protein [Frankia sp. AgPm24]|uniref:amino acid adenylation domain-containing protein n=1 Tax=Frankia sp. AgPm24 TaxID=631128 RepID=UPI00200D0DB8|nr:amino acid adenylation domain-containing protein [Frankia sp. AgPm24]MCK9921710.1 amino acid adenylation domain-containing protein [Frankia sp. AgPm24]